MHHKIFCFLVIKLDSYIFRISPPPQLRKRYMFPDLLLPGSFARYIPSGRTLTTLEKSRSLCGRCNTHGLLILGALCFLPMFSPGFKVTYCATSVNVSEGSAGLG